MVTRTVKRPIRRQTGTPKHPTGRYAAVALALVTACLAGCGRAGVDAAFDGYVSAFETDAAAHGSQARVTYGVQFGTPGDHGCKATAAGCCDVGFAGWSRTVIVDRKWWEGTFQAVPASDGEADRTAMLYHEFGHCSIGRKHKSGTTQIPGPMGSTLTVPESLMNPDVVSGAYYKLNKDGYLNELFQTE
jgi:hypothetical protein